MWFVCLIAIGALGYFVWDIRERTIKRLEDRNWESYKLIEDHKRKIDQLNVKFDHYKRGQDEMANDLGFCKRKVAEMAQKERP